MEATNHGLRRELSLWDLVMMQVLLIVSLNMTGYASKQGPSQLVLWLLAMLLFYLPLAVVVMKLSRAIPMEGGVYQWVKEGISPFAGYMAGWSLTVYIIVYFASYGSQLANGMVTAGGSEVSWMANGKWFVVAVTIVICLLALVLNVVGLKVTKWLSGIGSLLTFGTFFVLLYLLIRAFLAGRAAAFGSFTLALPAFSMMTLNVFTKMALFTLSGFDQCGIFAEECQKPKNDVARSVLIAGPLIAFMYILTTCSMIAYIPTDKVDLAAPVSQVMLAGFGGSSAGRATTAIVVGGYSVSLLAALILVVGLVSRLPMAAGWDGLLPDWWSALHPRYKTPTKAIGAVTLSIMLIGLLSLVGEGNEEGLQVLQAAALGSYCLMYLLLFGQVVFGFRSGNWHPGIGIRLGALAAFLVVVMSLVMELAPLGEVANPAQFAIKVTGTICVANGFGVFLYWSGKRRRRNIATVPEC